MATPEYVKKTANPAHIAAIRSSVCLIESHALERYIGNKDSIERIREILANALHELDAKVFWKGQERIATRDCEWEVCSDQKCLVGCPDQAWKGTWT